MNNLDLGRKYAKSYGGFYDDHNVWNALKVFPFDNHVYRDRVETIIVRNNREVFVKKRPDGEYFLPGGSKELNVDGATQAENECREEARINVRNIEPTGIQRKSINDPSDVKKSYYWDAAVTEIYVADYDSMYSGQIRNVDKDPFILSGKFYPVKHCLQFFDDEHREALVWYLKNHIGKNEVIVESVYKDGLDKFLYNHIKTPESLLEWMKSNISYSNYTKLKSPEEVYETKTGSCHDQSAFTYHALRKMHLNPGRLFVIESNPKTNQGGETHSFTYYVKKKKYFWFESAWGGNIGIHGPYDDLNQLKDDVKRKWNKKKQFPELYITSVKNVKDGMSLQDFVNSCCDD